MVEQSCHQARESVPNTFFSELHCLSPVDHILPPVYTNFCLAFRSTRFLESQSILKAGVQKLVSLIPWISGEIVCCNDNGLLSIQGSTGAGEIPMIQFSTDGSLTLEQITRARTSTGIEELRLLRKLTPLPLFPSPSGPVYVVRFKATMVSDGVVLAMSACHYAFDAAGAVHLMRHLAECCHGANPQGCLDDKGLRQDVWAIGPSSKKQSGTADLQPIFVRAAKTFEGDLPTLAQKTRVSRLRISGVKLARLKRACNFLLKARFRPNSGSPVQFLSTHDVLAGLLTRVIHLKPPASDGASDVGVAVNFRDRLTPRWTSGYMGNFVTLAPVPHSPRPTEEDVATAQRLITETGWIDIPDTDLAAVYHNACSVRQGISTIDDEYIKRYISWVASHRDLRKLDGPVPPLTISSWRGLEFYDLYFGPVLDKAAEFLTHALYPTKVCIILPKRQSLGSEVDPDWEVLLYLDKEDHSHAMQNNLLGSFIEP